ncbi:DUF2199 domain-containing protein [Parasedimentitalea maritima]|uniref:DUF2199 domain-containing protein n=2 Tax=Parasedimentitalea TaxID=2738399 RepID=A0A6L6WF71_9RHOB|nr:MULTISPECIES: DUF2199 domain-containing protein [Zongyanglinia]KAE9629715.1 DUF2199 domain-containing protein [Zongyanglinia marina]MVO15901.1 DUF2199 domain-containing protein [Zongyanglinia huanghaiensis]TLP67699.1 DUF2199 domain-containing protein [Zongyanglinia marina]
MLTSSRQCRCCGATFAQLLSLACDRPDMCPEDMPQQDNTAIIAERGDVLTDDFCRIGDLHFLRCVLAVPLIGGDEEEFVLGTWASVSRENFDSYMDLFELRETETLSNCPAWLSNAIPPGMGEPVAGMLHMRPEGQYPELMISETGHPLYPLQKNGAQLEELFDLLYSYGHDMASLVYDA